MAKYKGNVEHKDFLKGGAMQLASVLLELVKVDPEKFFRLAMKVPLDTDQSYVRALIGVVSDVDAVSRILRKHGFEVVSLLDPTRAQFNQAVSKFISKHGLTAVSMNEIEGYALRIQAKHTLPSGVRS